MKQQFTAFIAREGKGYVSLCPELDVASQGDSIEQACRNLQEAVELFLLASRFARLSSGHPPRETSADFPRCFW